jgi:hypothetical protein
MVTVSKIPQFGDAGGDVVTFQKALYTAGHSPGKIDGIFGSKTRLAASNFQVYMGLKGSGIVGPLTLKYLGIEIEPTKPVYPDSELIHINVKSPRNLLPALEALIDKAVVKSYLKEFDAAHKARDFGALMVICAKAMNDLKIREVTNKNDGYIVEMIQKIAYGKKGYAWCMYAVQVCVAWVECKTGVVSKLYSTGSCASLRAKTVSSMQVDKTKMKAGDIWIWRYPKGNGHTGVFAEWVDSKNAILYEGNTTQGLGSDGLIDREGGGFYKTKRAAVIKGMELAMVVRAFA